MNKIIMGLVACAFTMGPTLAHAALSTEPVDTVKTDVAPTSDVAKDMNAAMPATDSSTVVPKPTGDVTKEAPKDDAAKAAKDKDVADEGDIGCQATDTAAE